MKPDCELTELEADIADALQSGFEALLNRDLAVRIAVIAATKAESYFHYRAARVHSE